MPLTTPSLASLSAAGFVGALALVGALSHLGAGPLPKADVIKGDLQTAYEDSFKAANPLKDIAVGAFASVRYGLLNEASPGAIIGRDGWLFTAEELEVHETFAANIQDAAARIAEVRDELAGKEVRLIVAVVPDKADIYEDRLGLERPALIRQRMARFNGYLDQIGIDRIDAAAALRAASAAGETFMRDDTHWSPLGARAVAQAIGRRLGGADIARVNVETTAKAERPFDGDLLSFVPTGPFRGYFGPAQQTIRQFDTTVETAGGLFGDAAVDIVLVGTSYSAKPEWHFEGFLKQALSADVLNMSAEGQGPFAPMDAFLASDVLKNTPPKLVIWEIPVRYISKDLNR